MKGGRAPKARVCYICGRPTLLPGFDKHVIQCRDLFEKREAQKPPKERRPCPTDPMLHMSGGYGGRDLYDERYLDEANSAAQKAWESTLATCQNCGRTFLPEKLAIHQRSCTVSNPAKRVGERPLGTSTMLSNSGFSQMSGTGMNQPMGMTSKMGSNRGMSSVGMKGEGGNAAIDPMNDFPTYGHLQKCPNCGRNFNEVSYSKHVRICKKVFSQKRKVYDSSKHRIEGTEMASYLKSSRRGGVPATRASSSLTSTSSRRSDSRSGSDPSGGAKKWKAQSIEFRKAIRMAKQVSMAEKQSKATGVPLHQILDSNPRYNTYASSMTNEATMGYVQCPTCGRSFSEQAGARHIPKVSHPSPYNSLVLLFLTSYLCE